MRKPLTDFSDEEVDRMIATNLSGPIKLLTRIHRLMKMARPLAESPGQPYHLVVVASTSSYRVRDNETVYCTVKAAQAHFARNFARELDRDLPGSKVTLVNPGGIKTNLFRHTGQDTGRFMDPEAVAQIIWETVLVQTAPFCELNIPRHDDGTPNPSTGQEKPESPF